MEKKGIPAVAIVQDREKASAERTYLIKGVPKARTIYIPSAKWREKFPEEYFPKIKEALTNPLTAEEKKSGKYKPPVPPKIAMTGTYDEVQEFFTGDLSGFVETGPIARWTDGLPITPPTEEAVARMLTGTSHKPDEIVNAKMGEERRIVTVEKVAINAVMAGCKPEHLPLCLAITAGGMWNPWGSSNSMGLLEIVSGPIVKEIGMSTGTAMMSPGNPANMAISRFVSLAIRNLQGTHPGTTNISFIGTNLMGTVLAESPDTPWEGLNERVGFSAKESVIFEVGLKVSINGPGTGELTLVKDNPTVPEMLIKAMNAYVPSLGCNGRLIIVHPAIAREWKEKYGWDTMAKLQDFLWDNVQWPRKNWDASYWWGTKNPLKNYVQQVGGPRGSRMLNPDHADLPPDAMTPINASPKDFVILVAGGGSPKYNEFQPSFAWGTFGNSARPLPVDKWR